jgi:AAA domain
LRGKRIPERSTEKEESMSKYEAPTEETKILLRAGNEQRKLTVVKSTAPDPKDKKSLLVSAADLLTMKFVPEQWIVEDLLRVDSKRISLLAGQPRDGKSTLALQLCVAVAKAKDFLGRKTLKSSVIFWQTEAELRKVAASLQALGYNPRTDAPLLVLNSSAGENNLDTLRRELIAHPDVRLVVLETLDDILRIADLNKNTAARQAFENFDNKIVNDFSNRCAFLGLHHLNKEKRDKKGHMLMGATVIAGKTDAVWYIQRPSDDSEDRFFDTVNRSGRNVPPTWLKFDIPTQTNTPARVNDFETSGHGI